MMEVDSIVIIKEHHTTTGDTSSRHARVSEARGERDLFCKAIEQELLR